MSTIYRSIYPYIPQSPEEITLNENDYVIAHDLSDPDWIQVTNIDGLSGIVPSNYIEACQPISYINALYDYDAQASNEVRCREGDQLALFSRIDENWLLVSVGGYAGLVPTNYTDYQDHGDMFADQEVQGGVDQVERGDQGVDLDGSNQKEKLFAALEGLGPAPVYKAVSAPPVPPVPTADFVPGNVKLFPVTVRLVFVLIERG